jgi:hypothetical protein
MINPSTYRLHYGAALQAGFGCDFHAFTGRDAAALLGARTNVGPRPAPSSCRTAYP